MYCDACKKKFEEGISDCPDCGAPLTDKDIDKDNVNNKSDVQKTEADVLEKAVEESKQKALEASFAEAPVKNEGKKDKNKTTEFLNDETLPDNTVIVGKEYLKEELKKPLGVFFYFVYPLIILIPVLNVVVTFSWAFGKYINVNKRRMAIASLIWMSIVIIAIAIFGETIFNFFADLYLAVTVS